MGLIKNQLRRYIAYHNDYIWVVDIKAVGGYFSDVTGLPPCSLVISLGILYKFYPISSKTKIDENGLMYPSEDLCHRRTSLACEKPGDFQKCLSNPAERVRRDIWWICRDGSNLDETIENIRLVFLRDGMRWFELHSNKEDADASIGIGKQLLETDDGPILMNYWM